MAAQKLIAIKAMVAFFRLLFRDISFRLSVSNQYQIYRHSHVNFPFNVIVKIFPRIETLNNWHLKIGGEKYFFSPEFFKRSIFDYLHSTKIIIYIPIFSRKEMPRLIRTGQVLGKDYCQNVCNSVAKPCTHSFIGIDSFFFKLFNGAKKLVKCRSVHYFPLISTRFVSCYGVAEYLFESFNVFRFSRGLGEIVAQFYRAMVVCFYDFDNKRERFKSQVVCEICSPAKRHFYGSCKSFMDFKYGLDI